MSGSGKERSAFLSNNGGLFSILREFTKSVDRLNQTVLFPVRLQDLDVICSTDNIEINEVLKRCFNEKDGEANLYELYVLLRNTKSELITGNGVDGSLTGKTMFHKDLQRIMHMLKLLTELSETVRNSYEEALTPLCEPQRNM